MPEEVRRRAGEIHSCTDGTGAVDCIFMNFLTLVGAHLLGKRELPDGGKTLLPVGGILL